MSERTLRAPVASSRLDPPAPSPSPPRRTGRRALAVVLAVLVAAGIGGWVLLAGRGDALALTFAPGASWRYRMTMSMHGAMEASDRSVPYDVVMAGDAELRVRSVAEDGTAVVEEVFTNVTMTSDGKPVEVPSLPSPTLTIARDGRVVSSSSSTLFGGDGAQGPTQVAQDGISAVLSDSDVSPGDTWTTAVTETILGSPTTYTATSVYLRDERVGGATAAVVGTTAVVPLDIRVEAADVGALLGLPPDRLPPGAAFVYTGGTTVARTSWIDIDAGRLIETRETGRYDMTTRAQGLPASALPPGGVRMTGTVTMTLEPA